MYSWKQWAERMGQHSPPRPVCSVDSLMMAQNLAETGIGVALSTSARWAKAVITWKTHSWDWDTICC